MLIKGETGNSETEYYRLHRGKREKEKMGTNPKLNPNPITL